MGEFDDFFKPIPINLDIKKRLDSRINPVLYSNSNNPEIIILLEKPPAIKNDITGEVYLDEKKIEILKAIVHSTLRHIPNMKIISAIPFFPMKKDLNKTISDFYIENKIDLSKYIKPFSKVITEGRAINAITESSDLTVNGFYDFVFNDQHFYSPDLKSYVFPIDSMYKWVNRDNFENFFALNQIKNAYTFEITPERATLPDFHIIDDTEAFFREHWNKKEIALDLECSSLDFVTGRIGIMTISFDGRTGYLLRWKDINVKTLSDFLRGKFLILANAKFDFKYMIKYGVDRDALYCSFDTLHAGHLLNEMRGNSLKAHAWIYTQDGGYDRPLDAYIKRYGIKDNFLDIPDEILFPYAMYDPVVTYQVYQKMKKQIRDIDGRFDNSYSEWTLWRCYNEIIIPYVNSFVDIEYEGMPVNWKRVREVSGMLDTEIEKIREELYKELDIKVIKKIEESLFDEIEIEEAEINIDSGKELGQYLENLGWEDYGKGKADYYLTNDAILSKWTSDIKSKRGAELLIKYRELTTLQKTFIGYENKNTGIWKYRKANGKIYPNYMVMLTHSGRNRCKNPNFQNIPKHGEWAKIIRSIFTTPSDEYLFAEIDYAGLQLRIGAIYSGDEVMLKIFTELSGDMHSMTAVEVLARDVTLDYFMKHKKESPYKLTRKKAKEVNFGFEFGQVAFSFARDKIEKEWTYEEAVEYVKKNDLMKTYERRLSLLYGAKYDDDNIRVEVGKEKLFAQIPNKEEFAYYWTVASDIRNKFFETYKGLETWHKMNHTFAEENGYMDSSFGLMRRLPQLIYVGRDDSRTTIKNLHNICLNSPVQAFEIGVVALGMIGVYNRMKEMNLKSKMCGTVHDSCMFFIHKEEIGIMKKIIIEEFTKDRPEYKNIPIEAEGEIADVTKGEAWGFGSFWFDSAKEKVSV